MRRVSAERTHSDAIKGEEEEEEEEEVVLNGWLHHSRSIGGVWFGLLRDHSGMVQFVWERRDAEQQV